MKKNILQGYPKPKTSTQEVLLHLILFKTASIIDFPTLSGFRTRISQLILDHGLFLEREFIHGFNKFGNTTKYAKHMLPDNQKEKAIEIYYKINNLTK